MASGEYCWMVGSDDIFPPGSIARVINLIDAHRGVPGITVNKINFNRDYSRILGGDHEIVMPSDANTSRVIRGYDKILSEMAFLFCFISAHIVYRQCWLKAMADMGREQYLAGRHFGYSRILVHIVCMRPEVVLDL